MKRILTAQQLAGAIAVAAMLAFAPAAQAQTILKFSHTDQPGGARQKAAELFAQKVEQYTQGRYKVQVYPAGQLANDPKGVEQLQLGGIDFTCQSPHPRHGEGMQVSLGMVFDRMTARHHGPNQRRMALGTLADTKEGRSHVVGVEQIENVRRDFRVRAVVQGHRDRLGMLCGRRQMRPVRPQQRRPGP